MKKIISIIFILFFSIIGFAQEILHYDLAVDINVAKKTIDVHGSIDVDFKNQDHFDLVLWKNTHINHILVHSDPLNYVFDTISESPIQYVSQGCPLIIQNPDHTNDKVKVEISYHANMNTLDVWGNYFTDDWVELGFYSGWFPIDKSMKSMNFTSELQVTIDSGYGVNGSGLVSHQQDYSQISHRWGVFDQVIIASRALKCKSFSNTSASVDILYTKLSDADVDSISHSIDDVLRFYIDIFGSVFKGDSMKFVISQGERGGYNRKNFISYTSNGFNWNLLEGIAHELAHCWWCRANPTTWHDWLNESFANYSYLLYVREEISNEKYNELIDDFRKKSENKPPIWELNRQSSDAYHVLYMKGALLLLDLETRVGSNQFFYFLKKVATNNIGTTSDFLDLLEQEFSTSDRNWFIERLKK